ncbi:MAG: hypothetical protein J0H63_03155, partial [Rhizobiales bacterium]|nr:hypothetical protein [Hyphomicrobiales bacterium]
MASRSFGVPRGEVATLYSSILAESTVHFGFRHPVRKGPGHLAGQHLGKGRAEAGGTIGDAR